MRVGSTAGGSNGTGENDCAVAMARENASHPAKSPTMGLNRKGPAATKARSPSATLGGSNEFLCKIRLPSRGHGHPGWRGARPCAVRRHGHELDAAAIHAHARNSAAEDG